MSWLAPTSEPFHAESVNKADFQYKQGERQQPIRPRDELERSQAGAFAAESSSRDAYRAYEPQAMYRHQRPAYQKPEGSMDLRTTYGNQFADAAVKPGYVRLPPIRPESQHRQQQPSDADGGFAGGTEQADSYPNYRRAQLADAKQASCRPARQYQRPEAPFEARSSYAGDFAVAAAAAEKARPVRQEDQLRLSTEPMESRASASSNAGYGSGAAAGMTPAARRQPIVPRGELTLAGGQFAVETTQRGDFRPQQQAGSQPPRREPIRPAGELRLASGSQPFAARTVAQEDFAARRGGERPAPVRPRGELELSREPLAVATTSRDVYTPKTRGEPPPTRVRQQPQQQLLQLSTAG